MRDLLTASFASIPREAETIVPNPGRILPEMGMMETWSKGGGLADVLFTPVQQTVLGLLFGQPQRRFQSAELIRLAGSGTRAVYRQLQRLKATRLVLVTREGNKKYYQANQSSPIYPELHGLVVKTMSVVELPPSSSAPSPRVATTPAAISISSSSETTSRIQMSTPPSRAPRSVSRGRSTRPS